MTAVLSRATMTLAACCLGHRRRDWALAMEAEFATALADGHGFGFAAGCLLTAWREMPAHAEGRLHLARYAVVIGLTLPTAALLLCGAALGMPYPDFRHAGLFRLFLAEGHGPPFLNDGNRAAAPVVPLLLAGMGCIHGAAAWAMLDSRWSSLAALERLGAAATVTLVVFSAVAGLDTSRTLLPMAGFGLQAMAVLALMRLHERFGGVGNEATII